MKLFVITDVHGFYKEMIEALDKAGFDKNNPEHMLISCGDNLDRGRQPYEVMKYLKSLSNKVLVRGNHEDLILECVKRGEYWGHDVSNGTVRTIMDLGKHYMEFTPIFSEACIAVEPYIKSFISDMVDYYETENYILVHGWIPGINDWRNASEEEWVEARWTNGIIEAIKGNIVKDKTIICGHYHCSYGHHIRNGTPEYGKESNFEPYHDKGIIALDGCTAYSGKVNVVVLEDEVI